MRGSTKYLMAIMAACIITASLNTASASGEDISDLKKLISVNEDVRMNSQDLAFFLATHNYNVVPKDGYIELDMISETRNPQPTMGHRRADALGLGAEQVAYATRIV